MPQVLELIFDSVSGGQLAMMAATMVLAGFLRGFVGFGGGLVTVPILTLVFGPSSHYRQLFSYSQARYDYLIVR